jgi:hypothetical protein
MTLIVEESLEFGRQAIYKHKRSLTQGSAISRNHVMNSAQLSNWLPQTNESEP